MPQKKIAIIHPDLNKLGGAETVCLNVLEALQDDYEITFFTIDLIKKKLDWDFLNEFYHTNVNSQKIKIRKLPLNKFFLKIPRFDGWKTNYWLWWVKKNVKNFDLIFSTSNEIDCEEKAIQYIHFPKIINERDFMKKNKRELFEEGFSTKLSKITKIRQDFHTKIYYWATKLNKKYIENNITICNSNWTKKVTEEIYNVKARVVYPPVVSDFSPLPWEKKKEGFISIGRISPDKKILTMIEILSEIKEMGHNICFHIVGPALNKGYFKKIKERIKNKSWIKLEGNISRKKLTGLMNTHRYGIHAREQEHFGIVIAEMLKAKMLPFVKKGGGQAEIVSHHSLLTYQSLEEAVKKINDVLKNKNLQKKTLIELDASKYSQERFKTEIKKIVKEIIYTKR